MKHFIPTIIIVLLLATSCQKEVTDPGVIVTPPVTTTGINLKRFAIVDPLLTAPNDTTNLREFFYDAQNRCIRMVEHDYLNAGTYITENFYNGNDSLMSKRRLDFGSPSDTAWEYFTYNANGQMIADSLVADNGNPTPRVFVYKYTITAGNISALIDFGGNSRDSATYLITKDAAGNITREIDSNYRYNPVFNSFDFNVAADHVITYDARINPFYKIFPKRLVNLEYENDLSEDVAFYFTIPQPGNTLTEVRTVSPVASGLGTCNNRYTYNFNAAGNPVDVVLQDILNGESYKGFYFY